MLLALERAGRSLSATEMSLSGAVYGLDPERITEMAEAQPPLVERDGAGWCITHSGRAMLAELLGGTGQPRARVPDTPPE